jgi:hypothetical protein
MVSVIRCHLNYPDYEHLTYKAGEQFTSHKLYGEVQMARWLISQKERQFSAKDMSELQQLATSGTIGKYDLIQPPGTSEWIYAFEIEALEDKVQLLNDDEEVVFKKKGSGIVTVVVLLAIAGGFGTLAYEKHGETEAGRGLTIADDGISLSELIVTQDGAAVMDSPEGAQLLTLPKDTIVSLVGKRSDWYHVQTSTGMNGYIAVDNVAPGYHYADDEVRNIFEQLYNPDQFFDVQNTGWVRMDSSDPTTTTLGMLVRNTSIFDMTGMVLKATLKDKDDNEVQVREISVEGVIPAGETVWVGQLIPPSGEIDEARIITKYTYEELVEEGDETITGWNFEEMLTMTLEQEDSIAGRLDLIELRSIPNEELMPQ